MGAAGGRQTGLACGGGRARGGMPNGRAAARDHALGIEPTVGQRMQDLAAAGQRLSAPVAVGLMQELYRALVNDQAHRFAELFEHLLASDSPLVFHCTAGKDRTRPLYPSDAADEDKGVNSGGIRILDNKRYTEISRSSNMM